MIDLRHGDCLDLLPSKPAQIAAFAYYGGKLSQLKWLLPMLPPCRSYVEPFGGSAAVLLNRAPSALETYNDLDSEVVNFFRVARETPDELSRLLELTPYSREEFRLACSRPADASALERARLFAVRIGQSFSSLPNPSAGKWGRDTFGSRLVNLKPFRHLAARIPAIAARLLNVQIENKPAVDIIRDFDAPDTLIYCDPPYVFGTRERGSRNAYRFEMGDAAHEELADVLNSATSCVAVSGFRSELAVAMFPASRWLATTQPERRAPSSPSRATRSEVIWTNYDPSSFQRLKRRGAAAQKRIAEAKNLTVEVSA